MQIMITRRFLPTIALILSGCAGAHESYPSLAKRPVESAPMAEATAAPLPVPADDKLKAQISQLTSQAQSGSANFDKAYASADRAVNGAGRASVSSDAWVAAQVAISAAESARNDSVSALASLDTLFIERSNAVADGSEKGGVADIDAARASVLSMVDSQNDRIDALKNRLPQP